MSKNIKSNWVNIKIRDYVDIVRGYAFKTSDYESKGYPIVRVTNISSLSQLNLTENMVYLSTKREDEFNSILLRDDDFLMVMVGATIGKHAKVITKGQKLFLNQNMWCLRVKQPEYNSQKFVFYALQKVIDNFLATMQGSARNFFTQSEFEKATIELPPLPEQKKIAEILSAIDDEISSNIDKKFKCESVGKALINNFLKNVFSDGSNARVAPLGSVTEIKGRIGWKGYTKEDLVDSGALVIGGTQITSSNEIDLSKPVYISDYKYEESPEIMVNNGDLILVKTGNTIGKIALVPDWNRRATINPNTIILRANNGLNRYLLLLLSSEIYQKKLWDMVAVGAQPSVNQKNLKALEIPLIDSEKIKSLCDNFDLISNVAKLYGKRIALLTHLKQGVAADLFSGRKRVNI